MSRTILVTGASKGIGRAIALRLARDGFTLGIHYNSDLDGAEGTLADIIAANGAGRLIRFDTGDRAGTREALEADIEQHGAIGAWCSTPASAGTPLFPPCPTRIGTACSKPISTVSTMC